mmetsp:Transcript_17265/g.37789  ORF Transcript_17265/g.37789 Transcript_17265/m.37789 type:complete len:405 (+) Transcript_17265:92-1306(+)|eukprot:CAMPEP_0168194874 /NCGR_PEP_ID=MMETSP0139_2-20121125/19486_1 /TAXON_ID=44445 /ORGANISM="Pseudo-nitzschia australis, Strain 10249 10 AB" /LENGTH=404 /DNA_ID=CAMNT_0008118553 /DNA_START=26 /DNA_END=1240 /DNA_ORIENTATION=+
MEGLGGPVDLERYSMGGIDPSLEDCCRREVVSNRKYNALSTTLRRHDLAALAERRRRHLVSMPNSHDEACRCSADPNSDGGEYRALIELKERKQREQNEQDQHDQEQEEQIAREEAAYERKAANGSSDDDSDSDDEFDYLLDEDFGMEDETIRLLEEQRRAELEYQILMREVAGYHGYGVHRQLHPNRVLRIAGLGRDASKSKGIPPPPQAVVLHLVDADSMGSASLDYYIEKELAKECPGTMFVRSGGRSVLLMDSALSQKTLPSNILNPDKDLPALVAVRDGVAIHACPRLLGLGEEGGEIEPNAVRQWLDRAGVLLTDPPSEDVCLIRPEEEAHMDFVLSQMQKEQPAQPHEEEHYNCGVDGCHKLFHHEHVGVKNEEQSGLVVPENTILGGFDYCQFLEE